MKTVKRICHAVAGIAIFTATVVGAADKQHDRLQLHIDDPLYLQDHTLDQDRLRIHQDDSLNTDQQEPAGDQIHGTDPMTANEQTQYRNQNRTLQTVDQQNRFENQHQLQIRTRTQAEGISGPAETATQIQNKAGAAMNNRTSGAAMSGNGNSGSTGGDQGGNNQSSGGGSGSDNGGGGGGKR